ncbi:hypothetical protein COOONC_09344, partial [Cooperia oncophora]
LFQDQREREYSSEYRTELYEEDEDEVEEEYIEEETRTYNERIVTKRRDYGPVDDYHKRRDYHGRKDDYSSKREFEHRREESRRDGMAVDYSSQDFRQSLAAIDAASRDGVTSREGRLTS